MQSSRIVALSTLLLTFVGITTAAPITYTLSGTLSGTLGNTALTDVAFSFELFCDTSNIVGQTPPLNPALSTALVIGGSSGTFTEGVAAGEGSNSTSGIVGITTAMGQSIGGGITLKSPGAANSDLTEALDVTAANAFAASGTMDTSLGLLTITAAQNLHFVTTPASVPEPSGLQLMVLAGLVVLVFRRLQ